MTIEQYNNVRILIILPIYIMNQNEIKFIFICVSSDKLVQYGYCIYIGLFYFWYLITYIIYTLLIKYKKYVMNNLNNVRK